MEHQTFGDLTKEEWDLQYKTLNDELPGLAAAFGLSTDTMDEVAKIYEWSVWLNNAQQKSGTSDKSLTAFTDTFSTGPASTSMVVNPAPADFGTAPTSACPADAQGFVKALRITMMKNKANWTVAIGELLTFLTPEIPFNQATFIPDGDAKASIGNIAVHSSVKFVGTKNLYARVTGTNTWIFIRTFTGAHYDYHRVPTTPNTAESVDMIVYGVINNVQLANPSAIFTVLYQPQQTPPPVV